MSERSGSAAGTGPAVGTGSAVQGTAVPAARADGAGTEPLPTDPAALERFIDARRERLAATVDELACRTRPQALARQAAADLRTRLQAAAYTPDGRLRVERVSAVGAAVVTLLALAVWRRRTR